MPNLFAYARHALFEGGPPHGLQTWIGLIRAGHPRLSLQVIAGLAISWVPLAVLTALRGDFLHANALDSFILDFGAQARFLVSVPLLILAEPMCVARLAAVARQFVRSGLVPDSSRARYDRAVASTRRLMSAPLVELVAILLAYAAVIAALRSRGAADWMHWHGTLSNGHLWISPAGWWALLISVPFLLVLLFGWFWRVCLWTRFLWLMGRLDLQLVPAHPDHAAGLKFVGTSLQGFAPLGFVLGVLGTGTILNQVLHHEATPQQFAALIVGVVVFVLVICAGPLFVFAPRLYREQRRGMFAYGALAVRVGEQLESKWLSDRQPIDASSLEVPDFSATTDLYSIASNVYGMRVVPLEIKSLVLLVVATLLPFIPLALLIAPFDVIIRKLASLIF
jgi:hypothetical protein